METEEAVMSLVGYRWQVYSYSLSDLGRPRPSLCSPGNGVGGGGCAVAAGEHTQLCARSTRKLLPKDANVGDANVETRPS